MSWKQNALWSAYFCGSSMIFPPKYTGYVNWCHWYKIKATDTKTSFKIRCDFFICVSYLALLLGLSPCSCYSLLNFTPLSSVSLLGHHLCSRAVDWQRNQPAQPIWADPFFLSKNRGRLHCRVPSLCLLLLSFLRPSLRDMQDYKPNKTTNQICL